MKIRNIMLKKRWIVLAVVVLVVSVTVLLRRTTPPAHTEGKSPTGVQQSETDVKYSKKELTAEAERTYAVLKQYGIRVYGWSASVYVNAAKIIVDPRDKEKLSVTQEGVPEKHYYRLVRENDPAPVYIMFEGPYVHPVGID